MAGASGSTAYVYDIENRLVSASGAANAALVYDPLGRLFQISGATGTTQFLYDGDELVAEYNAPGHLAPPLRPRRRHRRPARLVRRLRPHRSRRFLHADHQGSIVGIADADGGTRRHQQLRRIRHPGRGANSGRFQYTGQAWLPELGMYYYKARIYSPTLGRFLQTDPIGYEDQFNLYAYVGNDPVNANDPTGEWISLVVRGAVWAAQKCIGERIVSRCRAKGRKRG